MGVEGSQFAGRLIHSRGTGHPLKATFSPKNHIKQIVMAAEFLDHEDLLRYVRMSKKCCALTRATNEITRESLRNVRNAIEKSRELISQSDEVIQRLKTLNYS
jgi:hypothetical protein